MISTLVGCSSRYGYWRPSDEFQLVRETMEANPSEALALLESDSVVVMNSEDESVLYEYQLLKAEVYRLNNCWQEDVDLINAVEFYDSLSLQYPKNEKLSSQTSKAHYYMGISEFEKEHYLNAVSHYLLALDKSNSDENKALIYNGLYNCFYYNSCMVEAMDCAIKADKLSRNYVGFENALKQCRARYFCDNAEYDSAMIIYRELLENPINTDVYDCENGIARCFLCNNEIDSAVFHFERALGGNKSVALAAANELAELCDESADTTMCLRYSYLYFSLSHNIYKNISENAKMTVLYNDFHKQQQIENQHYRKKRRLSIIAVLLLIIAVLTSYYIIRYKRRKEKEISSIRQSFENHRNIIEKAKEKNGGVAFSKRLDDFENCEICILLKDRLSKRNVSRKTISDCYDCALNKRETSLLTNNANTCFPEFSTLLVEKLDVKGDNIVYCCLCLLGFSIIEIAVLMKISYQAAHKRIASLKEILKTDKDVKEFLMGFFSDIYC